MTAERALRRRNEVLVDYPEATPPAEQSNRHGRFYQFSMQNMLVVLTTVSLLFAVYFGIGRAFGMSNVDILQLGVARLLYVLPMIIVWIVGIVIAVRRRSWDGRRSTLMITALAGFTLTALLMSVAQMVLIYYAMGVQLPRAAFLLGATGVVSVVLNTIWWVMILLAVFLPPTAANDAGHLSGSEQSPGD